MAFKASLGSTVLHRIGKNKYMPAIINSLNSDGTVNLTTFSSNGQTGLAVSIKEGDMEGNWCAPGVDAQEEAMAKAPPVSETGKLGEQPTHPPPLTTGAPQSTTPLTGKK